MDPTGLDVEVAPDDPREEAPFRLIPRGTYQFGLADGFVQTPAGGQPGTTSSGRPTLEELGIERVEILDLSLTTAWKDHELYLGGQWIKLSGANTLETELLSQGRDFPAGTRVSADVDTNWYSIAYRHRFQHDLRDSDQALTLRPSVGIAIFDFDYELSGGGATAGRSYIKPSPEFGLQIEWHLSDRWTLSGTVRSAVPLSSSPAMLFGRLETRCRLIDTRHASVAAVIGIGYEHIDYDDARKQETPNHVDVEMGPLFIFGLQVHL